MAVGEEGHWPTVFVQLGEGPVPTWPLGEHWPPTHLLESGVPVPHVPPGWPVEAQGVAAAVKRRVLTSASKRRKRR